MDAIEPSRCGVRDDRLPDAPGIADDERAAVLRDLVRQQGCVIPAHEHGHTAAAVVRGDLVGAPGGVGLDGHGDEVEIEIEGHWRQPLVVERKPHRHRGACGQQREDDRLHRIAGAEVAEIGADEGDAHESLR